MKIAARFALLPAFIIVATISACAGSSHSERALWIKIKEHGKLKTTIAITEPIARLLAEADKDHVHFSSRHGHDLITRDMLMDVIEGRKSSIVQKDEEENTEAELFLKRLDVPNAEDDDDALVMETYKHGKRTFRMKLGDFEIESSDDGDGDSKTDFSWKSLLPFLSETKGGVYIHDHNDDSEVWVFVD